MAEQVEIRVKYEGYIQRQQKQVEEFRENGVPPPAARTGLRFHSGAAAGGPGNSPPCGRWTWGRPAASPA